MNDLQSPRGRRARTSASASSRARCATSPSTAIRARGSRTSPRLGIAKGSVFHTSAPRPACSSRPTSGPCVVPRLARRAADVLDRGVLRDAALLARADRAPGPGGLGPYRVALIGNYGTDLALKRDINRFLVSEDPTARSSSWSGVERGEVRADIDLEMIVSMVDWLWSLQDALVTEELDPGLFHRWRQQPERQRRASTTSRRSWRARSANGPRRRRTRTAPRRHTGGRMLGWPREPKKPRTRVAPAGDREALPGDDLLHPVRGGSGPPGTDRRMAGCQPPHRERDAAPAGARRVDQVASDRTVSLTEQGPALASGVVRVHRLLERWLTDVLGFDWATADNYAQEIAPGMSDAVADRLDEHLGPPDHVSARERDPREDRALRRARVAGRADAGRQGPRPPHLGGRRARRTRPAPATRRPRPGDRLRGRGRRGRFQRRRRSPSTSATARWRSGVDRVLIWVERED